MKYTGNNLDFAISGEGFFRVQTPNGAFLSRNGSFCQSADGTLMTKQGWPVLGEGGPIVIPQGTRNIHVDSEGGIFADGGQVGVLDVVSVGDLTALEKVGGNLYRLRPGSTVGEVDPRQTGTMVNQGYLEDANVNAVTEMVNMIDVHRNFEAYQKMMQSSDAIDRELNTKVGKSR